MENARRYLLKMNVGKTQSFFRHKLSYMWSMVAMDLTQKNLALKDAMSMLQDSDG